MRVSAACAVSANGDDEDNGSDDGEPTSILEAQTERRLCSWFDESAGEPSNFWRQSLFQGRLRE